MEESSPFNIFGHEVYQKTKTLQIYRELVYVDIAKAILSGINDLNGKNKRSRLNSTRFRGDINALSTSLLEILMKTDFIGKQIGADPRTEPHTEKVQKSRSNLKEPSTSVRKKSKKRSTSPKRKKVVHRSKSIAEDAFAVYGSPELARK